MKRAILLLMTVVAVATTPVVAAAQLKNGITSILQSEAFHERGDIGPEAEADLAGTLAELAVDYGLSSDTQAIHRASDTQVLVIPLRSEALESGDALALLFDATTSERYFLLLDQDPATGGTVRLWGDGPAEIIIDAQGIYYSETPSQSTFRLPERSSSGVQGRIAANGVTDNIKCLASMLGLTVNAQNLTTALSSIVCQTLTGLDPFKRAVADMLLIAGHCFSAVNCAGLCPVSTGFCLTGLAKWISCGVAKCGTGSAVPAVPSLSSPANGAIVPGSAITLRIAAVSDATRYSTQLSTDPTFPAGNTSTSGDHGTSATWTGFRSDGQKFHWRARAGNNSGWSQWSSSRSFMNGTATTSVPAPPALTSPANGARAPGAVVTLFWNPSAGATKYQTQLSTDSSFSKPIWGNEHSAATATWQGFSNNGARWYWRVRAGNQQGWSQWSAARSFLNY